MPEPSNRILVFARKNWDEMTILGALTKVVSGNFHIMTPEDHRILQAFRRSDCDLESADLEDIRSYLECLDEKQVLGIANNVKGIAHELRFVEMENEDGDSISASMFDVTNHPDMDILLTNHDTGETWEIQLKATNSSSYVQGWIDEHPDGEILVTEEIADRMGLVSSGIENEEITANVDEFIERAIDDESLWDYFPLLSTASISIVIYRLYARYRDGELSRAKFFGMAGAATGWKAGKIAALCAALAIPGINVAVGAAMVAKVIASAKGAFERLEQQSPS